jgi:hypothetical protein
VTGGHDPDAEIVVVDVTEEERVVPRGTAQTRWYYRRADAWEKVTEASGAEVVARPKGPGTIWERAVKLRLAVGTEMRRVDERPGPPSRMDPLAYLTKGKPSPKYEIEERRYRVARGGRLAPVVERRRRN